MSIPPEPILRGAQRWLTLVPTLGLQRARVLFATSREYADLTSTQYAEAWSWLQRAGLIDGGRSSYSPEELLQAAIISEAPAWLPDADILVQHVTELPEDVLAGAEALGVSEASALACIRRAWGKVDTESRNRIGDQGERELLKYLEAIPGATVNHVASWSDAHGYDIAFSAEGVDHHFEVKATTRHQRLAFFLSRNEFETMLGDKDWSLVIVLLGSELQLTDLYSVDPHWIESSAPIDTSPASRWQSARFKVPPSALTAGVAALQPRPSMLLQL